MLCTLVYLIQELGILGWFAFGLYLNLYASLLILSGPSLAVWRCLRALQGLRPRLGVIRSFPTLLQASKPSIVDAGGHPKSGFST